MAYWVAFIVVETIASEYLGEHLGSVDFVGASIIALAIGALFYPIHKHAEKYVGSKSNAENNSGAIDPKSVFIGIGRSMRFQFLTVGRMYSFHGRFISRALKLFLLGIIGTVIVLIGYALFDVYVSDRS